MGWPPFKENSSVMKDWTFEGKDVAGTFDAHVREQLPWYELATGAVAHIIRHYLPKNGTIYDIGASTGNIGRAIAPIIEKRNAKIIPVEVSREMAEVYAGPGKENLVVGDISDIQLEDFDVAVLFLTLMFIAPAARESVLQKLRGRRRTGGAIIVMDKVVAQDGYLGTIMARLTLAGKVASGVPANDIIAKELSLMGVQRPLRDEMRQGREWFRFGEFVGWVEE